MDVEIHESRATQGRAAVFARVLADQCRRLGVKLNLGPQGPARPAKGRVALVFAERGSTWTPEQNATFERLRKANVSVLPVIPSPPEAVFIPATLADVNAFVRRSFGAQWPQSLVDEALSLAWLKRRNRKVFISYRRIDSGHIASQLYDAFNHRGYETFLDEASVRRGVDFQRELKWWLNDADLLLVLASPRFPSSRWCMEELTFCQQRFIGVAALQWPKEIFSGDRRLPFPRIGRHGAEPVIVQAAMADQRFQLRPADFDGLHANWRRLKQIDLPSRELRRGTVERIVGLCARQRTIAIRQRLEDLMPLARTVLSADGGKVRTATLGDLVVRDRAGKRTFVRVVPFRPQPENIRQSCADARGYSEAGCFYAENDPHDERAEALRWLATSRPNGSAGLPTSRLWACCGGVVL